MICTWNRTLAPNEKDLKQALIFNNPSLRAMFIHTQIRPHAHLRTRPHLHLRFFFFFPLTSPCLEVIGSCHLLSLSPVLSLFSPLSLRLIKSPALWYTAKPPGRFYGLLGPLFLPSFHSLHPSPTQKKMNDATPRLSCNPASLISLSHDLFWFFFLIEVFHVQQFLFYSVCFGKRTRPNGFSSEGPTTDTSPVSSMWFFSFMPRHSRRASMVSFSCPFTNTNPHATFGKKKNTSLLAFFQSIIWNFFLSSDSFVIEISGSKILRFIKSGGVESSTVELS